MTRFAFAHQRRAAALAVGLGVLAGPPLAPPPMAGDGDELAPGGLVHARHLRGGRRAPHGHHGRWRHRDHGHDNDDDAPTGESQGMGGIDSLVNFDFQFEAPGFGADGSPQSTWVMNIVGNAPESGGVTVIPAPIVPVSIDLLDVDGSLRLVNGVPLHSDVTPFIQPTLRSPLFQDTTYSSSHRPTQFVDAIQRAQFFHQAPPNWHTLLAPVVRTTRTVAIPFGSYQFAVNADGTCCAFITVEARVFDNLLFPPDPSDVTTPIGAAENAGEISTRDLATILLPNTFLYEGTPRNCCILGFHSYDFEPGDVGNGNRERRFVVAIASWISPGRLTGVEDVSALSHELAEAANDPFVGTDGVHNLTPWWQEPSGACQNKNEIADVVQGLPGAVFPVQMPEMTYHLQNQALLSWFQPGLASTARASTARASIAIDGAYSYPDETLLTAPTPLWQRFCQ